MLQADLFISVAPPLLGLAAIVVVGWLVVIAIRKWMRAGDEADGPFTLDDLRRLKREGKLTDAEFARAREALIGSVRSSKSVSGKPLQSEADSGSGVNGDDS
ncbi:MAG: hypothetical protein ACKO0W_01890 [Planctomycetota bacterium]